MVDWLTGNLKKNVLTHGGLILGIIEKGLSSSAGWASDLEARPEGSCAMNLF